MEVLSNKIERDELKPGDHIYTWRRAYAYAHHGIYVGEGKVIHFTTRAIGLFVSSTSSSSHPMGNIPCPKCGNRLYVDGVNNTCVDCFLLGGNLYLFKYGVTVLFFLAQARGGTCTRAPSDPPEIVIRRAKYLYQNGGFGSYDTLKNNCEKFATYCKTGLIVPSGQVATALSTAGAASSVLLGGLPIVALGVYCGTRLASDIGRRPGVQNIPVEVLTEMLKRG